MKHINKLNKIYSVEKYKGFTLVELLVSIAIMIIIMLLLSLTFTTLIKASIISNAVITTRDESDFALRIFENTVKQSNVAGIALFKSDNVRGFSFDNGKVVDLTDKTTVANVYAPNRFLPVDSVGNEIHLLPNGSNRWICIGYFKDTTTGQGVILKSSSSYISGESNHSSCFDSTSQEYLKNTIQLNTDSTDIKSLNIRYYDADNENSMILAEVIAEPTMWFGSGKKKEIIRQIVVTTRKLTSIY
jgi:prepilin-type N-terminal cleavage/methylation domain-containing protein